MFNSIGFKLKQLKKFTANTTGVIYKQKSVFMNI